MPHGIDALLIDVEGVLVSEAAPLPGALEASVRLRAAGVPFRLLTNITRLSAAEIARRLESLGFSIDADEIWNPPRLAARALRRSPVRTSAAWLERAVLAAELPGVSHLLDLDPGAAPPELVLLGDAGEAWSDAAAARLSAACGAGARVWRLTRRPEPAVLGMAASPLAQVPDVEGAILLAKPDVAAFRAAVADLGLPEGAVVAMVGDDLEVDVAGARSAGLTSVLVLSGRTSSADLEAVLGQPGHPARPDRHAENFGAFVHRWLKIR